MSEKPTFEELMQRVQALEKEVENYKDEIEHLISERDNFKFLAENANDAFLIGTGEGVHVYANKRAAEICGYSVEELLETTIRDLAHPEELKKIKNRYNNRLKGEKIPITCKRRLRSIPKPPV